MRSDRQFVLSLQSLKGNVAFEHSTREKWSRGWGYIDIMKCSEVDTQTVAESRNL